MKKDEGRLFREWATPGQGYGFRDYDSLTRMLYWSLLLPALGALSVLTISPRKSGHAGEMTLFFVAAASIFVAPAFLRMGEWWWTRVPRARIRWELGEPFTAGPLPCGKGWLLQRRDNALVEVLEPEGDPSASGERKNTRATPKRDPEALSPYRGRRLDKVHSEPVARPTGWEAVSFAVARLPLAPTGLSNWTTLGAMAILGVSLACRYASESYLFLLLAQVAWPILCAVAIGCLVLTGMHIGRYGELAVTKDAGFITVKGYQRVVRTLDANFGIVGDGASSYRVLGVGPVPGSRLLEAVVRAVGAPLEGVKYAGRFKSLFPTLPPTRSRR